VDELHTNERDVYLRLLATDHSGHRGVEQERIPLDVAVNEVHRRIDR
jgi:hypothetical protein